MTAATVDRMVVAVAALRAAEYAREYPDRPVGVCGQAAAAYAVDNAATIGQIWADYARRYPALGGL